LPKAYDEQVVAKKWNPQVAAFLSGFADSLASMQNVSATEIEAAMKQMATEQGINPGSLMQPLRVCLSGEAGGPPLYEMLVLIGLQASAERIKTAIQKISQTA
jgi:glutamyl-tRNA synthetase